MRTFTFAAPDARFHEVPLERETLVPPGAHLLMGRVQHPSTHLLAHFWVHNILGTGGRVLVGPVPRPAAGPQSQPQGLSGGNAGWHGAAGTGAQTGLLPGAQPFKVEERRPPSHARLSIVKQGLQLFSINCEDVIAVPPAWV